MLILLAVVHPIRNQAAIFAGQGLATVDLEVLVVLAFLFGIRTVAPYVLRVADTIAVRVGALATTNQVVHSHTGN